MLLTWSLHYVAHHLDMGTQLLREVDAVLGRGSKPPYTYERIVELRGMKRFLMEVLRLHPPVALDGLTALRDDVLPGDFFVPKGSMVLYVASQPLCAVLCHRCHAVVIRRVRYSAYHVHRRPDLYEDPLTFNPDRFIDATPSPYKFMAFHGGPRCVSAWPTAASAAWLTGCIPALALEWSLPTWRHALRSWSCCASSGLNQCGPRTRMRSSME